MALFKKKKVKAKEKVVVKEVVEEPIEEEEVIEDEEPIEDEEVVGEKEVIDDEEPVEKENPAPSIKPKVKTLKLVEVATATEKVIVNEVTGEEYDVQTLMVSIYNDMQEILSRTEE